MLSSEEIKRLTGNTAAALVKPGSTIGLGTGSTAHWLIIALGERIQQGLECRAVPTSRQTALLAAANNIPLVELNEVDSIHLTIDGADEIDPYLQLIKGGGGALLQEKMVAAASDQVVIIADHTKLVSKLGRFPLPVEVVPYNWKQVKKRIESTYKIEVTLRTRQDQAFLTDHNHYILDCSFHQIDQASALHDSIRSITGVVDCGLFIGMAQQALIGYPDGRVETITAR